MKNELLNILYEQIQQTDDRAITYEEYINTVLYHPLHGYYMKPTQKIGKQGDFITSSNLSNVFGMLFAHVLIDISKKQKLPFIICEIGAGNGRFAKAILDEWEKADPRSFSKVTYLIIETSPYHRQLQRDLLPVGKQVQQFESLDEVKQNYPYFEGIIISNELFDAFPVRIIEKRDQQICEVKVSIDQDGKLCERPFQLEDEQIMDYLNGQKINLREQQRFEVPLAMVSYLQEMGRFIHRGVIITIDYGYTNEEWMLPHHQAGSLRGYLKHEMIQNPLQHPGDMDLTTHISFDALRFYGEKNKLDFIVKMRQDEFLLAAGILEFLQEHHDPNPFSEKSKQNRAIRSLIMGGGMSQSFHVMFQKKGEIDSGNIIKFI